MNTDRIVLKKINIGGYKSIRPEGQEISFGDITVLLGANGSGKSNLVSFFKMLNYLTTKGLQIYIEGQGSASSLLYYGAKTTNHIDYSLSFEQNKNDCCRSTVYEGTLSYGMPDRLFLSKEKVTYKRTSDSMPNEYYITGNLVESGLSDDSHKPSKVLTISNKKSPTSKLHYSL